MNNKVETLQLNQTPQEFYGIINDSCPICGNKFITPRNIIKLGNVAYDLECYLEVTNIRER